MGKKKGAVYLGKDVLTASKDRIKYCLDMFDHFEVAFSGGKDSLVVLHLLKEVYEEVGIKGPVKCIFRDEEFIPQPVIDFVISYYHRPEFEMRYYAIPLANQRFILGTSHPYTQWDPKRANGNWMREKPDIAIKSIGKEYDDVPPIQDEADDVIFGHIPGRVALFNGIRCDEGIRRLQSVMAKKNDCFIADTKTPNVKFVKPIYDWSQGDVFKFLYDRNITPAPIYDTQVFAGSPLRVATPCHAEAYRGAIKLRAMYPDFFNRMIEIFPDMDAHIRYWGDYNQYAVIDKYPKGYEGMIHYVNDHIHPGNKAKAMDKITTHQNMRLSLQEKNPDGMANLWGYPKLDLFKTLVAGTYVKPGFMVKSVINKKEWEYEFGNLPMPGAEQSA